MLKSEMSVKASAPIELPATFAHSFGALFVAGSGSARHLRKNVTPKRSARASRHAVEEITKPQIKHSVLTPELRQFIDSVIVPILVKEYLAATETRAEKSIAESQPSVASFRPMIEATDTELGR